VEDDLKKNGNGTPKKGKTTSKNMEDNPKKIMENNVKKLGENGRRPQKKREKKEDNLKKILFSIPLKSRGKPFLGLAQLSKIFICPIGF
jgi:hypothetical protein